MKLKVTSAKTPSDVVTPPASDVVVDVKLQRALEENKNLQEQLAAKEAELKEQTDAVAILDGYIERRDEEINDLQEKLSKSPTGAL